MHVDIEALLPKNRSYFTYPGSLTTPPCTERVMWHVMEEVLYIDAEAVKALVDAVTHYGNDPRNTFNNRAIQELNDRTLFKFDARKSPELC